MTPKAQAIRVLVSSGLLYASHQYKQYKKVRKTSATSEEELITQKKKKANRKYVQLNYKRIISTSGQDSPTSKQYMHYIKVLVRMWGKKVELITVVVDI